MFFSKGAEKLKYIFLAYLCDVLNGVSILLKQLPTLVATFFSILLKLLRGIRYPIVFIFKIYEITNHISNMNTPLIHVDCRNQLVVTDEDLGY